MTRKERALKNLKQMCSDGRYLGSGSYAPLEVLEDFEVAIKALEQEPFINKPCVSEKVCEHDKQMVLNKIRAEIEQTSETVDGFLMHDGTKRTVLQIIDKYKAESEDL